MLPPRIQLTQRTESRTKSWMGSLPSIQVRIAVQLFQKKKVLIFWVKNKPLQNKFVKRTLLKKTGFICPVSKWEYFSTICQLVLLSDYWHPHHALCWLWLPDDLPQELRLLRHLLHRHDHRHHHRVRHPLLWGQQIWGWRLHNKDNNDRVSNNFISKKLWS